MGWPEIVLGFASGLLGALIGAGASTYQHKRDEDDADRAAARVIYFELAENTSYLSTAISNAVTMPVRQETWPSNRNRLSNLLSPGDFAVVATAYMKLAATAGGWSLRKMGSTQSQTSVEATREVMKRVEEAAAVVYPHAWPRVDDRTALDAQLREHVEPQAPTPPAP